MTEYIEREAAIALAKDIIIPTKSGYEYRHRCIDPQDLAELPAADVRPVRHGRWLIKTIRGDKRTVCSECLLETGTCYEENYCPNCGSRMDLDGDTE